jgi:hypothetical protein
MSQRYDESAIAMTIHLAEQHHRPHPDALNGWREIGRAVAGVLEQIDALKTSRDYTPEGRVKQIAAKYAEGLTVLQPLRESVARGRKRLAEIEARVATASKSTDLASLFEEREIRDRLQGRDALQIQELYVSAIAAGDAAFIRAVEHAPRAFALLRPEDRALGVRMKLDGHPDKATYDEIAKDVAILNDLIESGAHDLNEAAEADLRLSTEAPATA